MYNLFKMILDLSAKDNKAIIFFTAIWGWMINLVLLDTQFLTWEFILRGAMGIAFSAGGVLLGLIIKDFYALKIKDKIFKSKNHGRKKSMDDQQAA